MGKFRQIFTELPAQDTPIFLFPDDNKYITRNFNQTILTLRRSFLDLVIGKFCQVFMESALDKLIFLFPDDNE